MTFFFDVTLNVVIVKLADLEPSRTITGAGTLATLGSLDDKVTTLFPSGADERVIVPVAVAPPLTVEGEMANEFNADATGFADTLAELELSPEAFTPEIM